VAIQAEMSEAGVYENVSCLSLITE
jgi:hypothetical protein